MNEYEQFYPVIAPLIMGHGVGDGKTTSCLLSQTHIIAELARGKTLIEPSDEDESICPVLRKIGIRLNDGSWWKNNNERTEVLRPLIPLLLDSRGDEELTDRRSAFMCDNSIRVLTPIRLMWIAENTKNEKVKELIPICINKINSLAPITSKEIARQNRIILLELKSAADAYAEAYAAADAYAAAAAAAAAYADADAYAAADAYAYAAAYAAADADAAAYAYADAYAYAYADADADAYAEAHAAADAYAYQQRVKYREVLLAAFHKCAAIK